MADTIKTKRITDLPEDTDVNDNDLFMAGSNGTASLRKKKWSTLLAKIKSKLLANNLTTTAEGYALDARQGKALKGQVDQLNTKIQYLPSGHFELEAITIDNADTPMIYARNGVKINYAQSCTNHPRSGVITIFLTLKVNDLYAAQYAFCGQTIYYRFRNNGSMEAWEVLNP